MKILFWILMAIPFVGYCQQINSSPNSSLQNAQTTILVYHQQGLKQSQKGNYQAALISYNKMASLAKAKKNYYALAFALNEIGNIYAEKGDNPKALDAYYTSLKRIPDTSNSLAARINKNIGVVYISMKNFSKALSYYHIAEKYALKSNDNITLADCLNNKGTVYDQLGKLSEASDFYNRALKIYLKYNKYDRICLTYNNLAILSKIKKEYGKAYNFYKKSLFYAKKAENAWITAALSTNLGNLYSEKGDTAQARYYLLQSLELAKKIEAKELVKESLDNLATHFERIKQYDKAFFYQKAYSKAENDFINAENTKEIARLQEQFNAFSREKNIEQLKNDNLIQKLSIENRNKTISGIIFIFLIFIIISILLFKNNQIKQASKLQSEIMFQKDLSVKLVVEAELNERMRIAKDLHDGIGQLLAALKINFNSYLNFDKSENASFNKINALIDESCTEVRNISHQMAPYVLISLGLIEAIKDMANKIDERILKVHVSQFGFNERINLTTESVLFRVIQEVFNNVLKHAAAKNFFIQLNNDEDGIAILLEDDGRGFNMLEQNQNGIGLNNMKARIAYLKGNIEITSVINKGTFVHIYLPPSQLI